VSVIPLHGSSVRLTSIRSLQYYFPYKTDARSHGLRPLGVYQGQRNFERDILLTCRVEDMEIFGVDNSKLNPSVRLPGDVQMFGDVTPESMEASKVLEEVAFINGSIIANIVLEYVIHRAPYVCPSLREESLSVSKEILRR